jgi:Zn-finger nucleic acid-binding protein
MKCRKCNEVMVLIQADGVRYRECPGCFGRLIGNLDLKKVLRATTTAGESEAQQSDAIVDLAALVTESDTKQEIRCPRCLEPMGKGRLHQLVPVVVDTCKKCQMTWLDAGELKLIQRLFIEMQNSDDPKVMAMREKLAQIGMDIKSRDGSAIDFIFKSSGSYSTGGYGGMIGDILNSI